VRQSDVQADRSSAGVGGAAIGRFHDAAPSSRANDVAIARRRKRLRPHGDQACKLSRFRVVTAERTFGRDPRGAKENDRILHLLATKISQRFEILRDNSYRACVLAVDKFLVLISEGTMGS